MNTYVNNPSRLLFICCFFVGIGCFGQTNIPPGPVSGTWTKAASPYIINGDLIVPPGQHLTLEPGVTVLFTGYYKLTVNGSLLARGTSADSIVIDRKDANSSWHSIRIEEVNPGTDSTIFEYCRIEHTQYPGGDVTLSGGNAILVNNFHKVRVSHCLIRNNSGGRGGGVYAAYSNIRINNNIIRKNWVTQYGGGIYIYGGSAEIKDNQVVANYAGDNGGGIWLSGPGTQVVNNMISYNHSSWAGGGLVVLSNATVSGNLITYNESEHDDGGGMSVAASPKVINNTIAFNVAARGEGVMSGGSPQFINNIIFYNRDRSGLKNEDDEIFLISGSPGFYNCNLEGGLAAIVVYSGSYTGIAKDNLDALPLFKNPSANDFSLTWSNYPAFDRSMSPCIDAGAADTPHDPDGSRTDIGARYFHQSSGNFPPSVEFEADTLLGYNSLEVHFTDRSFKGNSMITEWHWDFGDGSTSTQQHPVHQYTTAGKFSVTLSIKDGNNFERSTRKEQYIQIIEGVYIKGKVLGTFSAPRYIVGGDVLVEETKTLLVTPGVEFVFLGPFIFEVRGALRALGTAQQPIVFTSYDEVTPVRWKGLYVFASGPQDSTVVDHCKIQYVENNGVGALLAFSENGAAGMRVSNSEICYNSTQGIHVSTSKVIVRNNYIHHNTARLYQDGAGIYIPSGSPKIINNIIAHNETPGNGGGICVDWSGHPLLINNTITNNKAYRGGGISDGAGWFESINNTIAFNTATEGGGYCAIYGGDVTFTNTIIANNLGGQVRIADPYSRVGFKNTLLQGGSGGVVGYANSIFLYENVLTSDPLLATGTNQYGKLLPGSPAVDAGTSSIVSQLPSLDILGNTRITNSLVDIGAYEYVADAPLSNLNPLSDFNVAEDFAPFVVPLDPLVSDTDDARFLTFGINPATTLLDVEVKNRQLKISPKPDKFGDQTVTLNVSDGTSTVSTSFTVHIAPVEDGPSFTIEGNVTVQEDFPAPRAYAINVKVPYGEENQSRVFALQPPTSDLVTVQLNPNGTLAFSSKPNAFGSQRFTLTLTEGQQTYSDQFTFTVKNVNDPPTITAGSASVIVGVKDSVWLPIEVIEVDGDPVDFGGYLENDNISVWGGIVGSNQYVLLIVGNAIGFSKITLVASDGDLTSFITIPVTIAVITGVEESALDTFNAYPNPTPGPITVTGRANSTITIYTTNVQVVLKDTMTTTELKLDLSFLKPGLYFLQVDDGKKQLVFKVVRQ